MAKHPLILTTEEQELFSNLPEELQEGWEIQEESLPIDDTMRQLSIRLALMNLVDPKSVALQKTLQNAKDENAVLDAIKKFDIASTNRHDVHEILFAMGPAIISMLIEESLKSAKDDDAIKNLGALATIRHSLLESKSER